VTGDRNDRRLLVAPGARPRAALITEATSGNRASWDR